jgi:hypothetical protein
MFSKPLAYPSTLDRRPAGSATGVTAVLRGGALEPNLHLLARKFADKSRHYCSSAIFSAERIRVFSLKRGLDSI